MSKVSKTAYTAPALVDLGDINVITEAVNRVDGGDMQFSVLATS